ncbi:MAG: hypothetical protein PWP54_1554 [Thermosipho sp. (in: thermotogales)]|nr:hypothetical protein [Thermosipho sp. (in: thermotogales)]MDN5324993.1 hypothetical protein [Thermosipho sp. (in: thermotogales)]
MKKLFIFRNAALLKMDVQKTENFVLPLEKYENVVFIQKADYYIIENSILNEINFRLIGPNENFAKLLKDKTTKILSKNPPILKFKNMIYYLDTSTNFWYETDEKYLDNLLNSKTFYAKNIEGELYISKPLYWDLFYDLKTSGELYLTYSIKGKIDEPINALLIDSKINIPQKPVEEFDDIVEGKGIYYDAMKISTFKEDFVPEIISEKAVINFGQIQPFNGELRKVFKLGTIKNFEDIPTLKISFSSNSFEDQFFYIYRIFDNTKENGIGFPLIPANIRIYEMKDNEEFLQLTTALPKTEKDQICSINLGQGWSVSADLYVINYYETEEYESKTFEIHISNHESIEKKILISFYTYDRSFDLINFDTDMEIIEKNVFKDKIEFYLKLEDYGYLNITLRSNK